MHPILNQRDCLDEIFSWLSTRDLAATICVNKAWFEASILPLWRTIDLSAALKLLEPNRRRNGFHNFSDYAAEKNWKRFILYAPHVRVLNARGDNPLTLVTAIVSRPDSLKDKLKYFFPNCRYVKWDTSGRQVKAEMLDVLFPPSVDHVVLTGREIQRDWFNDLCQLMSDNLPGLRVFHVAYDGFIPPLECSDQFLDLLSTFSPTLTSIQIPETIFTDATLDKLLDCDLHRLMIRRFSFPEDLPGLTRDYADPEGPQCLSSLKSLVFGAFTYRSLALETYALFSHQALTTFQWDIHEVNFEVDAFLMIIPKVSPNLETLSLGVLGVTNDLDIEWSSIKRLLECTKLTSLSLHCARVDMTLDNLVELLRSRQEPSKWHALQITTSQPLHFQDALLSVAKYSPKIHTLGLRVHDQGFAHLFVDIPELSSQLIPRHAKEKNIRVQIKLKKQLRRARFFLPCLSILRLNESFYNTPKSIGPMTFLLLAICDTDNLDSFSADDEDLEFRLGCRIAKYLRATARFTKSWKLRLRAGRGPTNINQECESSSDVSFIIPETLFKLE